MARRVSAGRTRGEETPPQPLPPPPPPRPHHRRDLPRLSAYFKRSNSSLRQHNGARNSGKEDEDERDDEDEDEPAPQPAPVPHAHPLSTLTGARPGAKDGRALSAKRLNPAFLNPARVAAFTDQENRLFHDENRFALVQRQQQQQQGQQEPTSALATEAKHSTRVIERQWRFQLEEPQNHRGGGDQAPSLTNEELVLAATDAATLRQELRYRHDARALGITAEGEGEAAYPELARAMERKVKKQLDPAWVRARSDPDNRPRRALERPEELDLYESLGRVTLRAIKCTTGLQQDAGEDSLEASFASRRSFQRLPFARRGFIGLPGSCFDPLHG